MIFILKNYVNMQKLSFFNAAVALLKRKVTPNDIEIDTDIECQITDDSFIIELDDRDIGDVFGFDESEFYAVTTQGQNIDMALENDDYYAFRDFDDIKEREESVIDDLKINIKVFVENLDSDEYNKIMHLVSFFHSKQKKLPEIILEHLYQDKDNPLTDFFKQVMMAFYDQYESYKSDYFGDLMQEKLNNWEKNLKQKKIFINHYGYDMELEITFKGMVQLAYKCRDCDLEYIFSNAGVQNIEAPSEDIIYYESAPMSGYVESSEYNWFKRSLNNFINQLETSVTEYMDEEELIQITKKLRSVGLIPFPPKPIKVTFGGTDEYTYLGYNVETDKVNVANDSGQKYSIPVDRLVNLIQNTKLDL